MRLPFLQVSQEEMARARTLAGYLVVPFTHALGMTVALKSSALEAATDGDVSGTIRDPNPAEWMAVQCGWPLDRADALAAALVRCGFAMAGPSGGYAVAGMEPYARALDTSEKRAEAGKRGAEARKQKGGYGRAMAGPQQTHGDSVARDAKTQTQTQTQKEETTLSAPPEASPQPATETLALVIGNLPAPEEALKPRPEDLQALWNRLAPPKGLARWEAMNKARTAAAKASLLEVPDLAKWEAWLASELDRPFNRGDNPSGWRADVDWLLRAKTRGLVADFDPATAAKPVPTGDRPRLGPPAAPPRVSGDRPRI